MVSFGLRVAVTTIQIRAGPLLPHPSKPISFGSADRSDVVAHTGGCRPTVEIRLKVFQRRSRNAGVKLSTALIALGAALIVIPLPAPIPFVGVIVGTLALLAGLVLRLFGV